MADAKPAPGTAGEHLERIDPAERADALAAQHWARYEWAARLVAGRRVLDCSCGVGYGSALLRARGAASVVGVDVSADAIAEAKRRYARPGVEYVCADGTTLSPTGVGTFERIVSLETIEHVTEPRRLLDAFRAVLEPGGVLALSCPNDEYLGVHNPFHVWRADRAALDGWLRERFAHVACHGEVRMYGTGVWPAAIMHAAPSADERWDLPTRRLDTLSIDRAAGFLYVCADAPVADPQPAAAMLLDGDAYVRELERVKDEFAREAQRLAAAWETQTARVRELDAEKDRIYAEAQRLAGVWEEQKQRIEELEQVKDRLWADVQRLTARVRELERARR